MENSRAARKITLGAALLLLACASLLAARFDFLGLDGSTKRTLESLALVALVFAIPVLLLRSGARWMELGAVLRLRTRRRVAIRDARAGTAMKLVGRVTAGDKTLIAPFSGRPCVAYRIIVDHVEEAGSETETTRVIDETDARPFLLTDETGTARVDPAEPRILGHRVVSSPHREPKSAGFAAFVETYRDAWTKGPTPKDLSDMTHLSLTERVVALGETVAVYGLAEQREGSEEGTITLSAPVILSDHPWASG